MPINEPTIVIQEDRTGCGIACAAMLAGKSYHAAKKQAKNLGIFPDDRTLNSDLSDLRILLQSFNIRVGKQEQFRSWDEIPSPAILAINWKEDFDSPSWHWAVFHRGDSGAIILDPSRKLKRNVRSDLGKVRAKWFVRVSSSA